MHRLRFAFTILFQAFFQVFGTADTGPNIDPLGGATSDTGPNVDPWG
jgi:hypothetical protein